MNPEKDIFSVPTLTKFEDMLKLNKEITAMYKQYQQFEFASKELENIMGDVKNKKITKVFMPTVGNMQIQVNPVHQKFKNFIADKQRQLENGMKGIEGQLVHRQDAMNQEAMFAFKYLAGYLLNHDFDLPLDELKKLQDKKKEE